MQRKARFAAHWHSWTRRRVLSPATGGSTRAAGSRWRGWASWLKPRESGHGKERQQHPQADRDGAGERRVHGDGVPEAEHRDHDLSLNELSAKPFLTPEEELRERDLKKRKLLLKDKMALIMRDFQKSMQG